MKSVDLACSVVVPTLNAALEWPQFSKSLTECVAPSAVLIVDSSSTDCTTQLACDAGFEVLRIERDSFNHGGTRQMAARHLSKADIIVYMTQDAVLAHPQAVARLLEAFQDEDIAAAFGRQLPRPGAGPIEAHARLFNYPAKSSIRNLAQRSELGLKTVFFSNSFGAYRRTVIEKVGGFPTDVIFGEDTVTVGHLLLSGWKVAYVAEAAVYHSHEYTPIQEFKRYFDIGVLHSREAWLLDEFGRASGEGRRFICSELAHLWAKQPSLIPEALLRSGLKFAGYHAGRMEKRISIALKRRLSMHQFFWSKPDET